MPFSFTKMESLEHDSYEELDDSSEPESPIDKLDVLEEIKDEIKRQIDKAIEVVSQVIGDDEEATDAVEETTDLIDETVEQTENLILLHKVIKEYGVSEPILKLVDFNGSFRKAVEAQRPGSSFESLSSTPDFGELKVACEAALLESIQRGAKTVWAFIRKLAAKIRDWFGTAADYFISCNKQVKAVNAKLSNISPAAEKKARFKVRMSGRDFEAFVAHYAKLTSGIAVGAVNIAREAERNLVSAPENEVDSVLLNLKEQFAKSLSGLVDRGKYKPQIKAKLLSTDSEKTTGWSVALIRDQARNIERIAVNLSRQKNLGRQIAKPIDDLAAQIQNIARKDDRAAPKIVNAIGSLASFVSGAYLVEMSSLKILIQTWLTVARAYISADAQNSETQESEKR